MQKGKMVLKNCPKCEKQVPVACKACPCGHIYFHARKPGGGGKAAASTPPSDSGVVNAVKRRRIEQVNQARATRGRLRSINPQVHRSHRSSTSTSNAEESDRLIDDHPKKRRARQKPTEKEEKVEQPEEDVFASVSPEKTFRYSVILAEINKKLCMSQNLQL